MPYNSFAYFYDELNLAADYDTLAGVLVRLLGEYGINDGIVADLGCGTGEVSLRLAKAGYDLIAVDASEDMLSVVREKLNESSVGNLLLLQQKLEELDLFGTVRAAVSTFDTVNHLPQEAVRRAFERVALFMEKDGVFLFDANTPFKHKEVLANNIFEYTDESFRLEWTNRYQKDVPCTDILLRAFEGDEQLFQESFREYEYPQAFWLKLLKSTGFMVLDVMDGERFTPLVPDSQRYLIAARKI